MTRVGYIWILVTVALAITTVSIESHQRDEAIRDATRDALYFGTKAGCDRDNKTRSETQHVARALHPRAPLSVTGSLGQDDCAKLAKKLVDKYMLQARP